MARPALLPPRVCSKPSVEQIYQHVAKIYNEIYNGFNDKMMFLFNNKYRFQNDGFDRGYYLSHMLILELRI